MQRPKLSYTNITPTILPGGAGLPLWGILEPSSANSSRSKWNQSLTGDWKDGEWQMDEQACRERPDGCWRLADEKENSTLSYTETVVDALIAGYGTFVPGRLVEQGIAPEGACGPGFAVLQGIDPQGAVCYDPDKCTLFVTNYSSCERGPLLGKTDVNGNVIKPLSGSERKCCLAQQLRTPSTIAGRFSVRAFDQETTDEVLFLLPPNISLLLSPDNRCIFGGCISALHVGNAFSRSSQRGAPPPPSSVGSSPSHSFI